MRLAMPKPSRVLTQDTVVGLLAGLDHCGVKLKGRQAIVAQLERIKDKLPPVDEIAILTPNKRKGHEAGVALRWGRDETGKAGTIAVLEVYAAGLCTLLLYGQGFVKRWWGLALPEPNRIYRWPVEDDCPGLLALQEHVDNLRDPSRWGRFKRDVLRWWRAI